MFGTAKKSIAAMASRGLRRNVSQRLTGSGFLGARFMQRIIVLSETAKPNMRSSPWMRGAPRRVLDDHLEDQPANLFRGCLLPAGFLALEIILQYK
jgi:hypothetical protein